MIRQRQAVHDQLYPVDTFDVEVASAADRCGRHDDSDAADASDASAGVEPDDRLRWVHRMLFADEASAREAGRRAAAAGWNQWVSPQASPYRGWVLRTAREAQDSHDAVAEARAFFESVCNSVGGSYTGWDVRRVPGHALY